VYAARGAHGSYPSAGTWTNCENSNLPPDRTGNGTRWNTWLKLANIRRQAWLRYGGGWGEVGADSPGVPPGVTTGPSGPYWKTPNPWCPCTPVN
jgi:hypothetical protein